MERSLSSNEFKSDEEEDEVIMVPTTTTTEKNIQQENCDISFGITNNEKDKEEEENQIDPKAIPSWLPNPSTNLSTLLLATSLMMGPITTEKVTEQLSPSLILAAFAASEGFKYYTTTYLQQQQLDQNKAIHNKEYKQAILQHSKEINLANEIHKKEYKQTLDIHKLDWLNSLSLHDKDLEREAEQHLQDLTNQLRESQKEADRDLWEQQNTEKQNTMTVTALLLTGAFALTVEGHLPDHTKGLWIYPQLPLVDVYYGVLALALSFLFVSILAGMASVRRMSEFMLSRTSKQQETLRELRQIAFEQLEHLHMVEDGNERYRSQPQQPHQPQQQQQQHHHQQPQQQSQPQQQQSHPRNSRDFPNPTAASFFGVDDENCNQNYFNQVLNNPNPNPNFNNNNSSNSPNTINLNKKTTHDILRKARRDFSKRLWEQPVLVCNWRRLGHGLHVVNFDEWYHYDMVSLLSNLNVILFKFGAILLLITMGIYVEAHRRFNDPSYDDDDNNIYIDDENEKNNNFTIENRASFIFWFIIFFFAIGFLIIFEVSEYLYPLPSWRSFDDNYFKAFKPSSSPYSSSSSSITINKFKKSSSFIVDNHDEQTGSGVSSNATSTSTSNHMFDYGMKVEIVNYIDPITLEPSIHNKRIGLCLEPVEIEQNESTNQHINNTKILGWKIFLFKSLYPPYFLPEININVPNENIKIPTIQNSLYNKTLISNHYKYNKHHYDDSKSNIIINNHHHWLCYLNPFSYFFNHSTCNAFLMTVNVTDMQSKKTELFELIDVDGNGKIDMFELCTMLLRFQPPPIPCMDILSSSSTSTSPFSSSPSSSSSTTTTTTSFQDIVTSKKSTDNAILAHEMLREFPMLQEALIELVEKLLHHEPLFIILKYKNNKLAYHYLLFILKLVEMSLLQIRNGIPILDMDVTLSFKDKIFNYYYYLKIFHPSSSSISNISSSSTTTTTAISKQEWDKVMNRIFLEKFF